MRARGGAVTYGIAAYVTWMGMLTIAFYAVPSWHIPVWSLIGASSAAAVITGVIVNQPRRRLPWILLAAAMVCFAAGDTTYNVLTTVGHQVNPFPSYADLFYIATSVLLVAGMICLVRAGTTLRNRGALIDSMVFTSGLGVVYWIFLISPRVHQSSSGLSKIISVWYPLTDVLVLALLARLLVTARRTPALLLLTVGVAGLLEADVVYGIRQLNADWFIGGPVDVGWIVFYAAVGAAALHRSMVLMTTPRALRTAEVGRTRLILLALSALVAPGALFVEALRGHVVDASVIAILSGIMFMLVMIRLSDVLASNRRALDRERALRQAGEALVSAADVGGVRAALHSAVGRMMGGAPFQIDIVADLPPDPQRRPARAEMAFTSALGSALPEPMRAFELALVCPMPDGRSESAIRATRQGGGAAAPSTLSGGLAALALAADEGALAPMRAPVEVLAAQVALALARISLTDEVNRRKSEEYFRTLVQNAADVILIVDVHNEIGYASPSAVSVFGDLPVVGQKLDSLLTPADPVPDGGLIEQMRRRALTPVGLTETTADWTVHRPDGRLVHVEASTQDLSADATVAGIVVTLRDVTDRRRLEWELTHHAYHDPLTGVANRLLFQERVKAAIERSARTVGVLFIDLDDFKMINDTMGHHAGDQLLVLVAQRLADVLDSPDSAARLGGDEFAALIEGASHPAEVEAAAERVIAALSEPFQVGEVSVSGTASIGVATSAEAADAQELLRQADLALYAVKSGGKGHWRRYQPELHAAMVKRMRIRTELDQAIAEEAFELYYQPIVELDQSHPVGFEALIRWMHPEAGPMPPADFIDIAEESGLIIPLGDWVMRTALQTAASWPDRDRYVSVNVSVRQFRTPGFVEAVQKHLREADLPPERLVIEITESLLLPDEGQVWSDLATLRGMGVRIAIDDFGTGYSSLSYLRRVPLDAIKIDRSFVETIGVSAQQRELVRGIIWLAATLGLAVIAEGIETRAERDLLVGLGCVFGQGYLFAPPLTQAASSDWRRPDVTGTPCPQPPGMPSLPGVPPLPDPPTVPDRHSRSGEPAVADHAARSR